MAITFVNPALGGTTTTTSFSITLPATAANDIIILEYVHRATADATIGGTYTGPAFTEKHDQQFATSTFSAKTLWSRATGNHSGQTVTGSGLTNSCAAVVTIYRGCLTSGDPLADATIVGEQNAAGNETQAQITTATNGAWVVLVVANSPDVAITAQTCTSPGTLTARAEVLSTGGTDASISHASAEKATAGATGAFTWAQTDGASGSWAYAIKPQLTGASWLEAADTNTTIDVTSGNVQKRLRIGIVNTASTGPTAYKWRYSKNSGAYADLTASSSNVKTFSSAYFADGADVPQILTAGNYQTDNNAAEETSGTFTLAAGLAAGYRFETEVALEFIAADLADNDTLDFRVTQSDGTVLGTYTVTPRATIEKAVAAIVGTLNVVLGTLAATTDADAISTGTATPTLGVLTSTTDADAVATASAAETLGALALSAAGTVVYPTITGSLNITLGVLTSVSDADAIAGAILTQTLGALAISSDADVIAGATLSQTLGVLTSTTDVDVPVVGTTAATLGTLTISATGSSVTVVTGDLSLTLGSLVSATDVDVLSAGALSATLGALGSTTDADVSVAGTLAQTLGVATLSATASVISGRVGNLDATLGALAAATDADVRVTGTAANTLGLTSTATAAVSLTGSLAQTLGTATATTDADALVAGSSAQTLGALLISASGIVTTSVRSGNLELTLGFLSGGGAVSLQVIGTATPILNALTSDLEAQTQIRADLSVLLGQLICQAGEAIAQREKIRLSGFLYTVEMLAGTMPGVALEGTIPEETLDGELPEIDIGGAMPAITLEGNNDFL